MTKIFNLARQNPVWNDWALAANCNVCSWWSDENTQSLETSQCPDWCVYGRWMYILNKLYRTVKAYMMIHEYFFYHRSKCLPTQPGYRIAENFRGRKLSWISWFCGYSQRFLCEILERAIFWHDKSEQSMKVCYVFFTNSWKFSPSNVSCYTVVTCVRHKQQMYTRIYTDLHRKFTDTGLLE